MAVAGNTTPQINLLHGLTPVSSSITANWHAAAANICVVGAAGVRYKVHSLIVDISALVGNFTPGMFISVNGVKKQIFPRYWRRPLLSALTLRRSRLSMALTGSPTP